MIGTVSEEIEVKVSASEAWKVYGTLQLADIALQQLPNLLHKIDVLEGDGGAGTILHLTFPPGTPGVSYQKEKFTVVDDEKRVKVAEVIEGGHLDLGFTSYRVRFEVIEKEDKSCITRATIEYEVEAAAAAAAADNIVSLASIQPFVAIMNAAAKFLTKDL